jgi:membrane-associated HD superfamily phosphohydrolase
MKSKLLWMPLVGILVTVFGLIPMWSICSDACLTGIMNVGLISIGISIFLFGMLRKSKLARDVKNASTVLLASLLVPLMMILVPASSNTWLVLVWMMPAFITFVALAIVGFVMLGKASYKK